jgi:hypothetical protein
MHTGSLIVQFAVKVETHRGSFSTVREVVKMRSTSVVPFDDSDHVKDSLEDAYLPVHH